MMLLRIFFGLVFVAACPIWIAFAVPTWLLFHAWMGLRLGWGGDG